MLTTLTCRRPTFRVTIVACSPSVRPLNSSISSPMSFASITLVARRLGYTAHYKYKCKYKYRYKSFEFDNQSPDGQVAFAVRLEATRYLDFQMLSDYQKWSHINLIETCLGNWHAILILWWKKWANNWIFLILMQPPFQSPASHRHCRHRPFA